MENGIHKLDEQEYWDVPRARWSSVKTILDCPAAYQHHVHHPDRPSGPKELGTLVHAMVLEPDQVDLLFIRGEKCDRRTKVGKARWAELQEEAGDREVVEAKMWDQAMDLAGALRKCMDAELPEWRNGRKETAVLGSMYDIPAKCKIDLIVDDEVWDIKTARDLHPKPFSSACHRYAYYGQIACYTQLLRQHEPGSSIGGLIVVQTVGPPVAHVLRFNERAQALGLLQCDKAWSQLANCRAKNIWPGYDYDGVLDAPVWWSQ